MTQLKDLVDRLAALEQRVSLLEIRASVLRSVDNQRVLEVLGRHMRSPFNDGSFTMTPDVIRHATGLDDKDLALALDQLQRAGFVELVKVEGTGRWRVTDDGLYAIPENR